MATLLILQRRKGQIKIPITEKGVAYSATVSGITELMVGFSFIMVPNTISTSQSIVRKIIQLHGKLRNKK